MTGGEQREKLSDFIPRILDDEENVLVSLSSGQSAMAHMLLQIVQHFVTIEFRDVSRPTVDEALNKAATVRSLLLTRT